MNNNNSFLEFVFRNNKFSLFWFFTRIYLGITWLESGISKLLNNAWVGENAGKALGGFVNNSLSKTAGAHPDVSYWYAYFLENIVLPNTKMFSYMIAFGETLVGVALILGFWVGITAFFSVFMNTNFLFAGSLGVNPQMLILGILLMVAYRTAGYYGLDRFLLKNKNKPSIET